MRIAVIGGGAWGTTLAQVFAKKGQETVLWVREHEVVAHINTEHENTWYLPGITLDERLTASTDMEATANGTDYFVFVVPSQFFRRVLRDFKPFLGRKPVIICANKGIELETLSPMSEVVEQELGDIKARFAMISGPSFAAETSREIPTTVALGCADKHLAKDIQDHLSTEYFRIYTNPDYKGVELGGALKNIIAIAAGCADGLEFGSNARAALITRGLAEMGRLGKAMGANPKTFQGLSGMGDLVLTCTGDLSRNRQVGLALGQGKKLTDIMTEMKTVAEGVKTTESVYNLARKLGVPMPITEQLYAVLYEDKDPRQAVHDLMTRALKDE